MWRLCILHPFVIDRQGHGSSAIFSFMFRCYCELVKCACVHTGTVDIRALLSLLRVNTKGLGKKSKRNFHN